MPPLPAPGRNPERRRLLRRVTGLALTGLAGPVLAQAAAAPAGQASARAAGAARNATPPIGAKIDLPSTRLLDGREIAPAYWRDKVVVVELWASWCPFCKRQNPHLDRLHRAHAGAGLEVLALSIDRNPEDARRYMREHGYAFHAAMFDERWHAAIGRPKGLPIVWVIGRDGALKQVEIGEMFPEDVEELARWRTA
ncbi:MAG: TlpA family protein disulfide reductase [Burkholderiaceae bacterium]|nr:TlpA family protein disulfide reductase [Burkholderiaceae bacterium]